MMHTESTSIAMCDFNHDIDKYDCSEPYTAKVSCDAVYIIGGYHGNDQNEGAEKFNRGLLATGSLTDFPEPMIVCVS